MKEGEIRNLKKKLDADGIVAAIKGQIAAIPAIPNLEFYLSGGYIQNVARGIDYGDIDVFVVGNPSPLSIGNQWKSIDARKEEMEKAQARMAFYFFGGKTKKMERNAGDDGLYEQSFHVYEGKIAGKKAQLIFHSSRPAFDFKFLEIFYNLGTGNLEGDGLEYEGFGAAEAAYLSVRWHSLTVRRRFLKYLQRGIPLRDDFFKQTKKFKEDDFYARPGDLTGPEEIDYIAWGMAIEEGLGLAFCPSQPHLIARSRVAWQENKFDVKKKKGLSVENKKLAYSDSDMYYRAPNGGF